MKAATSFLLIVNFLLLSSWTVPPSMGYGPTPLSKPTAYKAEMASYLGPLRLSSPDKPPRTRIREYFPSLPFPNTKPLTDDRKAVATTDQVLRAVANEFYETSAPIDVKELCESYEFYLRTRKRILSSFPPSAPSLHLYDLCSGHGLSSLLYLACNPGIPLHLHLLDVRLPPSHPELLSRLESALPWFDPSRVHFHEVDLRTSSATFHPPSEPYASISVHACGSLTDVAMSFSLDPPCEAMAHLPCCYTGAAKDVPYGMRR